MGERRHQPVVEKLALGADLAVLAHRGIEQVAVPVKVVLRLEHLAVAGIERPVVGEIPDGPGEGGERLELGEAFTVVEDLVRLDRRVAAAQHQMEAVRHAEAAGGKRRELGAVVLPVGVALVPVRHRIVAGPVEQAADLLGRAGIARPVALHPVLVAVEDEIEGVGPAQELHRAGEARIEGDELVVVGALPRVGVEPEPGCLVEVSPHVEQFGVILAVDAREGDIGGPAVVETMLQLGHGGGLPARPVRPVGGIREAAAEMRPVPVREDHRHAAPFRADRVVVAVFQAEGEPGRLGEVGLDGAVVGLLVDAVAVDEGAFGGRVEDEAAAHRALTVHRRRDIEPTAVAVPAAGPHRRRGREFGALRPLAGDRHRRPRLAGPGQQARRPAQHFHPVDRRGRGMQGDAAEPALVGGDVHAVDDVVRHPEPAGIGAVPVGLRGLRRDAGGIGEDVQRRLQVLVRDALRGDDADRLRRFADAERQAGGAGRHRRLVAARALGAAVALALDRDGAEHGVRRRPCRVLGGGATGRRQHQRRDRHGPAAMICCMSPSYPLHPEIPHCPSTLAGSGLASGPDFRRRVRRGQGGRRRLRPRRGRGASHRGSCHAGCAFGLAAFYQQVKPASATTVVPVTRLAASEARKCTTEAISWGWPMRCIGVSRSQTSIIDWSPYFVISVSI